eukprot:Gb_29577 [translate_table: standard]
MVPSLLWQYLSARSFETSLCADHFLQDIDQRANVTPLFSPPQQPKKSQNQTRHPLCQFPSDSLMLPFDISQAEVPQCSCTTMHHCPFEL